MSGEYHYLKELNETQRSAAEAVEGPVMVIAGAGSGKTRVLTFRIAHLMNLGVSPFNILALTFTNKAAREMKERIGKIVGESEAKSLWMGTFHSVFSKILRIESEKLGYPSNFAIYDTDDSKSVIKGILKEMSLDDKIYKPGQVYNRISGAKNSFVLPADYMADHERMEADRANQKPLIGEIYKRYQIRLFKAGAMDFDDILINIYKLLEGFPDALNKYQLKFRYIMVDEYQDTNHVQYLIIKQLAAKFENICVVGDDAQSIYSFRGANIDNILNFKKDYPDVQVFKLEQNYRSTQNIVNAANSVIWKNKDQIKKEVWTDNDRGEKIKIFKSPGDNEEGIMVARTIFDIKMQDRQPNSAFAILYRTNAQSRAMEEALRRLNIPYRIYGGLSFYQRKEVKDLLAYFRLTVNSKDEEALKRVINYPARGIGATSMQKIQIIASEQEKSLWEIMENLHFYGGNLSPAIKNKISAFVTMIKSFAVTAEKENAYDLGMRVASASGLLKELHNDKTPEGVSRFENIQELLNGLKEFSVPAEGEEPGVKTLGEYMQDIALLTDADTENPDDRNKVSLMTVHAAKGLEFPYVFIVGLEENLFPSQMAMFSREDFEEERRLFYVALTRAERQVYLSFAISRYRWGNLIACEPSRFLKEVDEQYLEPPADFSLTPRPVFESSQKTTNTFQKRHSPAAPQKNSQVSAAPQVGGRRLVNVSETRSGTGPATAEPLEEGMKVEHDRFGMGVVEKVEGAFPNQKATIAFESAGNRNLLLKFAKLKILN